VRTPKTPAQKAADRLRRQRVKQRGERWQDQLAAGLALLEAPHTMAKVEPPVKVVGREPGGKHGGVFRIIFLKAGGADFEGGFRGVITAVEAKDTADQDWSLGELDGNQSDRLLATHRQRGIALVALRLGVETRNLAWALPWQTIAAMRAAGKRRVSVADLQSGDFLAYRITFRAHAGQVVADLAPVLDEETFRLTAGR